MKYAIFLTVAWGLILPAFAFETPPATIGRTAISAADLDARTAAKLEEQRTFHEAQLRQYQLSYDRARHAYVEQELNAMIDERVLALEAAAKKTTPAALNAAVKTHPVSDAEVRAFYDTNKAQIPQAFDAVAAKIRGHLQAQSELTARRAYLDSLRVKYKVVISLDPLREQVAAQGPQRGSDAAPVTIVEFSDFQCPYCGQFEPTMHEVLQKYPKTVRLVYRNLPLANVHPFAQMAAEASVCAGIQGKFWEMHDLMFAEQSALGVTALKEKARRIGLDGKSFDDCLDGGKARDSVKHDVDDAELLGIDTTPTSFVNGRFVGGSVSALELSAIIEDEMRRR